MVRDIYLLRLPAGPNAITSWTYFDGSTRHTAEVRPWTFNVVAGSAVYVGGIGLVPTFSDLFGCRASSGRVFHFTDPVSDIALARARFPILATANIIDQSTNPAGWLRGPAGFD